jgi:hypothetical protein
LARKIQRAGLDRLHAHRNVAVSGEEHDRQQDAAARKTLLQFEAIQFRHRDIEHQTT